jgi:hypothetical protein
MKTFTPGERIRLNFLYDLLDLNYRGLREAAQIQRATIFHGRLIGTVIADIDLVAFSQANSSAWSEIQIILKSATDPAPEAAPEADSPADSAAPKKERLQ